MKKTVFIVSVLMALAMWSCGQKEKSVTTTEELEKLLRVDGDSTIYGLACEGCNDTIVVFLKLSYEGADPDTLNILEASRTHNVFGTPRIGDRMAIVRNAKDTTVADIVVVTEDFQGHWCYRVKPTLRQRADIDAGEQARMLQQLPDSIVQLLMEEREYSYQIKSEGAVYSMGARRSADDDESMVTYPQLKRYREWHIFNGQLVLQATSTDSLGRQNLTLSDTAQFVMLGADTLVLRFADGLHGFYRKAAEASN